MVHLKLNHHISLADAAHFHVRHIGVAAIIRSQHHSVAQEAICANRLITFNAFADISLSSIVKGLILLRR